MAAARGPAGSRPSSPSAICCRWKSAVLVPGGAPPEKGEGERLRWPAPAPKGGSGLSRECPLSRCDLQQHQQASNSVFLQFHMTSQQLPLVLACIRPLMYSSFYA